MGHRLELATIAEDASTILPESGRRRLARDADVFQHHRLRARAYLPGERRVDPARDARLERGPRARHPHLDLGLVRNVALGQSRLQLRVNIVNVLNTPDSGNPNASIINAQFGRISSVSSNTMEFGGRWSF